MGPKPLTIAIAKPLLAVHAAIGTQKFGDTQLDQLLEPVVGQFRGQFIGWYASNGANSSGAARGYCAWFVRLRGYSSQGNWSGRSGIPSSSSPLQRHLWQVAWGALPTRLSRAGLQVEYTTAGSYALE